jgi:hypothetical protein
MAVALGSSARRFWRSESTAYDLVVVGGLAAYPLIPALVPTAEHHRGIAAGRRVLGAMIPWPVEGLAFWPALRSHLRRSQQAPAKTPR